ncbi:acetyltransferase [Shinella sumterensis]|uniref:acetyltransferase n=1 Tax=Shinella sumterensis TaxID=1967501 RepID=UPI003F85B4C2
MTVRVVCIGGGGHAAVVIDSLQEMARNSGVNLEVAGFTDATDKALPILGVPCLGTDADLRSLISRERLTHFIVAVGSIKGGGNLRAQLFSLAEAAGLVPFTVIHPSSIIAGSARIACGSVVMAGAVIQPRVQVGQNVIVNTRASLDHDCCIGHHAHVAPGAIVLGGVVIDDSCHIGAGAIILQNVRIGRGATIAAGGTVVRDVADGAVVKGTPAR